MMKSLEKAKCFIMGVLVAIVLCTSFVPVIAGGIDVLFNSINIIVNGKKVAGVGDSYILENGKSMPYSILYNGTTYLPMRKVSEILDKDVYWDGNTKTAEINNKTTKEELVKKVVKEKEGYDSGITYSQLSRTPKDYIGRKLKFIGKIVQVSESEDEVILRVAINSDYNSIIIAKYHPEDLPIRVLEDDIIIMYGISKGLFSYTSVANKQITIPSMDGDFLEITEEIDPLANKTIIYDKGPYTFYEYYSSGSLYKTTYIYSIALGSLTKGYNNEMNISSTITGKFTGEGSYFTLKAECYDLEGILLTTENILQRASPDKDLRFETTIRCPMETVKIIFVGDK